jgi:hypothetical protein
VAFVGHDKIKCLDGYSRVVFYFARAVVRRQFKAGFFLKVRVHFLAAQHGIEPLDSADSGASNLIDLV